MAGADLNDISIESVNQQYDMLANRAEEDRARQKRNLFTRLAYGTRAAMDTDPKTGQPVDRSWTTEVTGARPASPAHMEATSTPSWVSNGQGGWSQTGPAIAGQKWVAADPGSPGTPVNAYLRAPEQDPALYGSVSRALMANEQAMENRGLARSGELQTRQDRTLTQAGDVMGQAVGEWGIQQGDIEAQYARQLANYNLAKAQNGVLGWYQNAIDSV